LDWTKGQQEETISQIGKIIKQAIGIAISEAQMNRRKMTVSQMTGCMVLEEQLKDARELSHLENRPRPSG
jgi:predicted metalloenzyme YecM